MNRFVSAFLLSVWVIGCQTAIHEPKPTVIVREPKPATSAKQFWAATAKFLQPLMPDIGEESEYTAPVFAANHHSAGILPANHSSRPLYKAGSILPPRHLLPQTLENTSGENSAAPLAATAPSDSVAPLPDEKLAAEKRSEPKRLPKKQAIEPEYEDEFDDEPIIAQTVIKRKSINPLRQELVQTAAQPPAPAYPSLTQLPNAPPIMQASYQQPIANNTAAQTPIQSYGAGDWQSHVRAGIDQLRYAIEQTPNGKTPSNEMRLRVLEMLLGNKAEAVKPMPSADKAVNEFMGQQVLGFAALLDDSAPDNRNRYIGAAYRFREGLMQLQNLCPIKIKKVILVKDWLEYGVYIPRIEEYHPGEDFLVYMEVENLTVRNTSEGFNISLSMSYEIRDASANIVVKQEAGKPALSTQSRKQDYCLNLKGAIPQTLSPGQYQLRISMTDLNDDTMQYAEEQIPFKVAPSMTKEP
jgi:hypothetical protein